jgi:hypothetical protein
MLIYNKFSTKSVLNKAKSRYYLNKEEEEGSEQGDLLDEIEKHYEEFDEDLKAKLPLKRIWTLVEEEQD